MKETIHIAKVEKYCNYIIKIHSIKIIDRISILEDTPFGNLVCNNKNMSFNYFNGELDKISIKILSISNIKISITKKDIDISQIYIADHLKHFSKDIHESYPQLVDYHNDYLPAIFYGLWSDTDYDVLKKNKSLKIIIWTGGDIYIDAPEDHIRKHVKKNIDHVKSITKTIQIAISKFIENDLVKIGEKYLRIPFMGIDFKKYEPIPKGNSIYIYTSPFYGNKYGENFYSKIVKKYKNINFIFTCSVGSLDAMEKFKQPNPYNIKYYDKKELIENIYPQCFVALRLTNHDGLAGTVQELGALGIKSIHNGDSPSCLNYNTIDDIYKHIDDEIKTIGMCDHTLSTIVKKYLTMDPHFFSTSFFKLDASPVPEINIIYDIIETYKYNFSVKPNCNYEIIVHSDKETLLSIEQDLNYGTIDIIQGLNIFNYFNGNSINILIKNKNHVKITIDEKNIKIKQIYVSERLRRAFHYDLLKTHLLVDYYNDYEPAIFYGIWSQNDLNILKNNKSLKIIIWTGGDINHNIMRIKETIDTVLNNVSEINKLDKIKHISISPFISKSLSELNLKYKEVPFMGIDFDMYKAVTKGKNIYVYTVPGTGEYYGSVLYNKVVEKYKNINFIFTCWINGEEFINNTNYKNPIPLKYYDKKELIENIYPQCFLGLRMTIHDGLSATVQELGLMGIKCVHNGNGPSSLNYKTFEDVCQHIDNEIKTIGTCDTELANKVKDFLTINPNFLNTNFHSDNDILIN